MSKLVMTPYQDKIMTALVSDRKALQISMEPSESSSILGNIYIGKVKNIIKNINSAFIEIADGQRGYYSLEENTRHHILTPSGKGILREGDELIVQVSRDAVKTKDPVLTCNLSFTGKYCVLTAGKNQIGFSNKIRNVQWKNQIKEALLSEKEEDIGIIVRTNAQNASVEQMIQELQSLKEGYHRLLEQAAYRTCYSLLYKAVPAYVSSIRDTYADSLEEIITDDTEIYHSLKTYMEEFQPEDTGKLKFYEDNLLPLKKLYSLESALEAALGKRVWLKSGGNLVIEQTEAMVVIDVNTGKYAGKKNVRDTILKINLEAAEEIGRQLILRNLSGIIIVDFIDMEAQEDKDTLMKEMEQICFKDPVKTVVMDMTRLNLVEITRKKVRKPLHEQVL